MFKKISMKGHKENYFVLGLGLMLTFVVVAIAFIAFTASTPETPASIPTIQPTIPPPLTPTPTYPPSNTTKKYITYDTEASNRLLDRVNKRIPLSENDKLAKAKILALFPPGVQSGVLHQTETIIIDYTQAIDLFMVEILIVDVAKAKAEANVWFRVNGMSQRGLCNLPLMFYLNAGVVQSLQNLDIQFNPVAPTC